MDQAMYELLKLFITALAAGVFTFAVKIAIPYLQSNFSKSQMDTAKMWAETLVMMAEQVFPDYTGPQKKRIVTDKLSDYLISKRINLTHTQISDLIEAAVKGVRIAENTTNKKSEAPAPELPAGEVKP